jgi:ABC-2 type transport system permease protein
MRNGRTRFRLKRYLALAIGAMKQKLAFRNAFLLSTVSHLLGCCAVLYLWRAVYAGRSSLQGFVWPEFQTYVLLTFFTNVVMGWHSEMMLIGRIIDGSVAVDLLKPLDFQLARLAETLGMAVFEGAIALFAVLVVAISIGNVVVPASLATFALSCLSFGLGLVLKFGVMYLTCLLAFWSSQGWGIVHARIALTQLLSGALVPLPFMPAWLRGTVELLPFQGIVYLPSSIYLGRTDKGIFAALGLQLMWAIGLLMLGRLGFKQALRRLTIHGG